MEQHIVKIKPMHYMPDKYHFGHLIFCSTVQQSCHFDNVSSSKQRLIQYCSNATVLITFAALDFESLSSSFRNSLFGYGIVIPAKALKPQRNHQTRGKGFIQFSNSKKWVEKTSAARYHYTNFERHKDRKQSNNQ